MGIGVLRIGLAGSGLERAERPAWFGGDSIGVVIFGKLDMGLACWASVRSEIGMARHASAYWNRDRLVRFFYIWFVSQS